MSNTIDINSLYAECAFVCHKSLYISRPRLRKLIYLTGLPSSATVVFSSSASTAGSRDVILSPSLLHYKRVRPGGNTVRNTASEYLSKTSKFRSPLYANERGGRPLALRRNCVVKIAALGGDRQIRILIAHLNMIPTLARNKAISHDNICPFRTTSIIIRRKGTKALGTLGGPLTSAPATRAAARKGGRRVIPETLMEAVGGFRPPTALCFSKETTPKSFHLTARILSLSHC